SELPALQGDRGIWKARAICETDVQLSSLRHRGANSRAQQVPAREVRLLWRLIRRPYPGERIAEPAGPPFSAPANPQVEAGCVRGGGVAAGHVLEVLVVSLQS